MPEPLLPDCNCCQPVGSCPVDSPSKPVEYGNVIWATVTPEAHKSAIKSNHLRKFLNMLIKELVNK